MATRGAPAPAASVGRAQRRAPGAVPAAFTAVEGTYHDLAAPASRKVLSVVALTALVLVAGVMLAAVAAAVLAAAAELVDGAVG